MESFSERVEEALIEEVGKRGMDHALIPHYVRDLANFLFSRPDTDFPEANDRMHRLGWDEIELDYRVLELAKACFENEPARAS
jgi:hypothetical protein